MSRIKTYQFITKCLSLKTKQELLEDVQSAIETGDVDWNSFFRTGSNHLVLQNVYSNFISAGLTESLPDEVHDELRKIYDLNQNRNINILKQAVEINKLLQENKIEPIFLKGVAHLMNDLYSDPAERLLADIDILIAKDSLLDAVEILKAAGYAATTELTPDKKHIYSKHHPRMFKPDLPAYVEIHWEAVKPKYSMNFSADMILKEAVSSRKYPLCKTPSDKHTCIHNFIHSQLEHRGNAFARVYLRNLYDLLQLSKNTNTEECFSEFGMYTGKSLSYLFLTEKHFGTKLVFNGRKKLVNHIFLLRHDLNIRIITLSLVFQFIHRIFISYLRKPFLIITRKDVRKAMSHNLSNAEWYRQHFKSYRKIFGKK